MTTNLKILKSTIYAIVFLITFTNCQNPDYKGIKIERFDIDASNYVNLDKTGKAEFHNKYSDVIELYINKIYPDTNISICSKLENFANSKATKYFTKDINFAFSDISAIQKTLSFEALNFNEKANIKFPKIFTAIIPYNQSILINDSTAIIGLNHYLGKNHPAYEGFPSFRRNFKISDKIPYDLAEAIIKTKYPYTPKENTLLERMLYEGTVAMIASEVIPDFKENLFFNFSSEQLLWCKKNEAKLWNQLLIDESLYISSESIIAQYLNPAPFTPAFTQDSPGMACRWIGMRIVNSYIDNTGTSALIAITKSIYQESQATLINSKYNGK